MRRHRKLLRRIFVAEAYRTYGNLSRFFMQFGIRQIANYDFFVKYFPDLLGMGSAATLDTMIAIEVVCSAFLIFGFLTRLSVVLPTLSMAVAEWYILDNGLMAGIANMPMGEVALMKMPPSSARFTIIKAMVMAVIWLMPMTPLPSTSARHTTKGTQLPM